MLRRTRFFLLGTAIGALTATVIIPPATLLIAMSLPEEDFNYIDNALRRFRAEINV